MSAKSHPCVFRGSFVREEIDPRVKERWERRFGGRTPFGNLRLSFRQAHCGLLNPYDSRHCPYPERDCALSFYQAVITTCLKSRSEKSAVSYFRTVAKTMALDRAENKPLTRDRDEANTIATKAEEGPGHAGGVQGGDRPGPTSSAGTSGDAEPVRSRISIPPRISDVLAGFNFGPREGRPDDGEAGPER